MIYSYALRSMYLSNSWEKLLFEVDDNQHRAHNWLCCRLWDGHSMEQLYLTLFFKVNGENVRSRGDIWLHRNIVL